MMQRIDELKFFMPLIRIIQLFNISFFYHYVLATGYKHNGSVIEQIQIHQKISLKDIMTNHLLDFSFNQVQNKTNNKARN